MTDWPPGSHLIMETTVKERKYYVVGYKYNMKKVLSFISAEGAGHTGTGTPDEVKWLDDNGRMASRRIARPHMLSEYFKESNQIDKHNHVRQSQLAIEKHVITTCGYFRLWCTYLGITITDSWTLYRHGLGDKSPNKEMSILSFANILCKTNLLNDYSSSLNESKPNQTLRSLTNHNSRELAFPSTIEADPNATPLSSLGSGSSGALIQIGNGKYIPASHLTPPQGSHLSPYNRIHPR